MAKKKENEETGVTTIQSSEVTVIPSKEELQAGMRKTLKELDDKLAELSVSVDKPWKVGNIQYYGDGYSVCVNPSTNGTDMNFLIKILGHARRSLKEHQEIVKEFKLTNNKACLIGGFDAEVVIEEFERRIKLQNNTKTIADIKAAKAKLEAFLSEDDRLIKTLSEVEGLLK